MRREIRQQTNWWQVLAAAMVLFLGVATLASAQGGLFVDAQGEVGVGTDAPEDALHVISDGTPTNGQLFVENTSSTSSTREMLVFTNNGRGQMTFENRSTGQTWQFINRSGAFWFSDLGDGPELAVQTDGDIGLGCRSPQADIHVGSGTCGSGTWSRLNAGETSFTASSSRALKENLKPIEDNAILEKIADVGVYQYDFKRGPKDRIGLMAEDFHQVFGRGEDTSLSGHEVQVALWLAVQELAQEKEEWRSRYESLLARVEALEAGPLATH